MEQFNTYTVYRTSADVTGKPLTVRVFNFHNIMYLNT